MPEKPIFGRAREGAFDTKASSRKTPSPIVCAGWNLYSLRKNPRFYMSLLLGFLLCWLLTDKTMAISRTYLTNVQIMEPFVWCYADGDSILYAALVMTLMLSSFPRIDTPASYLIFRTTKLNWLIGQIITVFVLTFGYCACDGDMGQYQGAEYDVVFLDEAGQLQKAWIDAINACVRGTNGLPKRTYYTLNPGGPGHGYFKRLFIDRRFEAGEEPENYSFVQALVTDNRALMRQQPEYLKQLETLPPKLREAWLYGSWDVYEGQFFEDFRDVPEHYEDRQWTHVIEPFAPDKGWTVCRSYDFGYGKPFSCAWWAVDYDGVIYRILELYGCTRMPNEGVKWTPDRQFAEIRRIETEHPWLKGREITGVADPAIWDASRGESVAQTAARYGVYFTPGDNERIAGWMQCHYRLQFDENGYPRMYVFKNCKAFIRTVPLMLYSQTRPEDLDTAMEDHVCDEWRYFCMSRPVKPMMQAQTAAVWSDPLNQIRS